MLITYKYRLYPTNAQRTVRGQMLSVCRWLYTIEELTPKVAVIP
jgi:hypothetical protein